ncbi:PREDICTED: zinc finger BED domain-containing, partial [Prunus dulcis]
TLGRRFLEMYTKMKEKLKVDLRSHRICLTTDTWISVQNVNYMVLTAHFVDSDYKMHKRILNFCVIDSHKWESIGKLLENCLIDWGHEKILTITADNAAANTKAIEYVRKKINGWKDSNSVLGGVHMHMRCSAHIINLIVKEGLKRLESSIVAIRNAVKFV